MPEEGRLPTLLIADADVRQPVAAHLRSQGFDVIEVENGLDALAQVRRTRPASVVLDLLMPRLEGLDAIKRLHAIDLTIRVVVLTEGEDPELDRQALALGAAGAVSRHRALTDLGAILWSAEAEPGGAVAKAAEVAPPPAAKAQAGGILVVDDEPEMCRMLERLLSQKGYRTRSVGDGAAAVRAVLDGAPDLVLLDINMPRLGGIEALTAIRAIAPAVKVIMVSGQSDLEVARRALAYGAFDYVAKPFDPGYLWLSVEAALASKGLDAG